MAGRPSRGEVPKRQQILAAARELFLDEGLARVSMERIAGAAGVSKQTLYAQFADKEQLFIEVVHDLIATLPVAAKSAVSNAPLRDVLVEQCQRIARSLASPEAVKVFRLVISESVAAPGLGQRFYEELSTAGVIPLAAILEEGVRRGEFVCAHPMLSAEMIVAQLKERFLWPALLVRRMKKPRDVESVEFVSYVVDSMLASGR